MPDRILLTQARIRELPLPGRGQRIIYDAKVPGFGVRLSAGGARSFVLYRKINRRPQIITLGRYPSLSVDRARKLAEEHNGAIARGLNPQDQKAAARAEITFGDLFQEYLDKYARTHKRTWESDATRYRLYLKPWANRQLTRISRAHVLALHSRVGQEKGHYAANRLLSLISRVFNFGKSLGSPVDNPAIGVKRFKERSRERFLLPHEMSGFLSSVREEPNDTIRDFFLLALLTGQRKGNVLAMKWEDIDLEQAEWIIPAAQSKNQDDLRIPITNPVLEILERRQVDGDEVWVLPSHGDSGHLVEPKTAWKRILQRAGINNLRIHDLRRSLGSWQAGLGVPLTVIGRSLGHKSYQSTLVYSRLTLDPVRLAMEQANSAMLSRAGGDNEEQQED